jgi:hypothetical protein
MMNADICLSTTPGLDVYQWKRSANVKRYVHILHAAGDTMRPTGCSALIITIPCSCPANTRSARSVSWKSSGIFPPRILRLSALPIWMPWQNAGRTMKKPKGISPCFLLPPGEKAAFSAATAKGDHRKPCADRFQNRHPSASAVQDLGQKSSWIPSGSSFPTSENLSWNFDNDNFPVLSEADVHDLRFFGCHF